MTKSMACPFCGMAGEACYVNGLNGAAVYQCQWCGAQTNCQEEWETRPLEESLRDKNEILQSKLAREHQVSDALYLLLVDDPNTKLQADQILINIFGKCEPSNSDVSVTENVLMDVKTQQSIEIEDLETVVEHLKNRLSEWQCVARQLADELAEANSERFPVSWEDASETSPAWTAYCNLRDVEDENYD